MQNEKYIIGTYFTSPFFFIVGAVAAYLLVYNFATRSQKPGEAKTLKGDSTVKVVAAQPLSTTSGAYSSAERTIIKSENVSLLQPQKGRRLPQNNPPPIESTQAVKNAANLSYKYTVAKIISGKVWNITFIALAILLIAFFSKKNSILDASETDKDPPELQILFKEFRTRIELFRNPRKVLRFFNLVKYHYYFLTKNDIGNMENLMKMMWILLEIQENPEFVNINGVKKEELSTSKWFYKRILAKPWHADSRITEGDNDLLMIILKLNVDMGS